MVVTLLGQQYNIGEKPTVMQINYNMMCIVSPRKDHLTFLRRKPYPPLNTYDIIPIQTASKEYLSRPFLYRARVIYKYSFLVTNSTQIYTHGTILIGDGYGFYYTISCFSTTIKVNSNSPVIGGNRSTIYSPRAPVKYYASSTL